MKRSQNFPIVAAVAFVIFYLGSKALKSDVNHNYPGGRHLLQSTSEPEEECYVEPNDGSLNYNNFVYCLVGNEAGAMVILVIWWLMLFSGLATCADEYFCPALVVISNALGLSPNVAGVTFLALGNGAPDFFAAFSALSGDGGSEMGIGAIFGAAIFVTTIIIGAIGAIKPFKASERPFLRDIIFYIAAVYWGFYMLWRKKIYFWETVGYLILYIVYVVVVIVSSSIYKRRKEANVVKGEAKLTRVKSLKTEGLANGGFMDDSGISAITQSMSLDLGSSATSLPPKIEILPEGDTQYESLKGATANDELYTSFKFTDDNDNDKTEQNKNSNTLSTPENDNLRRNLSLPGFDVDNISAEISDKELENKEESSSATETDSKGDPEPSSLTLLLYGICPINIQEWPEMSIIGKCFAVFKAPLVFFMTLACPVVNYDDSEHHNWNRPLQCLQLFISPSLCLFLIGGSTIMIGDVFPVIVITLIIGIVLSAINFFLTSNFPRPKYHNVFAIYGFIAALILIYVLANEIVGFLNTFGSLTGISDTILGLTFLAWGNSMGDLMANVVMARQGFPKMSFAACFGASLFNLTLGFGFPLMVNMITSGESEQALDFGPVELVLAGSLMFTLVVNLAGISIFQRFRITRPYGGLLLVLYLIFLVIVVLAGTEVILADLVL